MALPGVFQKIQDNNRSRICPSPRRSRLPSSNNTTTVNVAPAVVQQSSRQQSSTSHNSTSISAPVSSFCPHCKRPFSALAPTSTDQVAHRQNYVNRGVVPDRNGQQMTFSRQPPMNNVNSAQRGDHQYSNSTNPPQVAANPLYQNMNIRSNNNNTHSIVTSQVGFGNGVVYPDPTLTRGVDHQYSNSTKLSQVAANLQQYAAPQYHNMDLGNNNNIRGIIPKVEFKNGRIYSDFKADYQYPNSTRSPQVAADLQQYTAPQDLGNNNNNNTRSVISQVEFENGGVYSNFIPTPRSEEVISNGALVQQIQILEEKKANFKDALMKDLPRDQEKTKEEEKEEEKEDETEEKLDDVPWETVKPKKAKKKTAQVISNSQRRGNGRDKFKSKHQKIST